MYLQSVQITNFRKFGSKNNIVEFVQSDYKKTVKNNSDDPTSKSFVACATTLIIGKNNAGKTTVTKALKQVIDNEKIFGSTFNLNYIKSLFDQYSKLFSGITKESLLEFKKDEFEKVELPIMKFKLKVGLDTDPKSTSVQNLSNVIPIEDNKIQKVIVLEIKFIVSEDEKYKDKVYKIFSNAVKRKSKVKFNEFLRVIDTTKFSRHIYDIKGRVINSALFSIKNLFDLTTIKANLDDGETSLSSVFNKIVQYRLKDEDDASRIDLEDEILRINEFMDDHIGDSHREVVNNVVGRITEKQNMLVHLRSNLDFESLFNKLISYEFKENSNFVPENQFGLGYSNLMKILGQIIDYVEQYEGSETHNKVNIICIEEPENFMHPQMQELFIKNIDDALNVLLGKHKGKNINSQLIITTHSSHIVNSKIHSSNTFNNINYITTDNDGHSNVVTLNDQRIINKDKHDKTAKDELKFLKKHIKYKVSELFFSDAIILVEGITEEHILQHYLSESKELHKYGISIFNINGAFAHIYKSLIDLLKIPCLVITDLDIKRDKADKGKEKPINFQQISKLDGHETTNSVLHKFICTEALADEEPLDENESKSVMLPSKLEYFCENNFKIVFQKDPIHGFIASSFEEAYILTNYQHKTLNETLKELKPRVYKRIVEVGKDENPSNSKEKSFEWQCKLASSKSDFANTLLYKIITSDIDAPPLPNYIEEGLTWLNEKLTNSPIPKKGG
jgi:predicted ATP-dependent endonuclease of OLD family